MKEPKFPDKLRIFIEPRFGVLRNGFAWRIEGYLDDPSYVEGWYAYCLFWSTSLHDMNGYKGWKSTAEKAEAKGAKQIKAICEYQCRQRAAYEKWKAGFYTVEIECDDCTD